MSARVVPDKPTWAPGRKAWIDVAKGAAIFLVVLYHSTLYVGAAGMAGMPAILKIPLELFPMPAFFVLAGMTSSRTVTFTFGDLFRRRVLPMLYLYVVWSTIRFLFFLLIPAANSNLGDLPANSIVALALIFLWPSSSYWFLYALALFTVGAWLLRRVPAWVSLGATALLSAFVTSGWLHTDNIGWDRVLGLFVFYLFGIHLAKPIAAWVERSRLWGGVSLVVLFAGFVGFAVLFSIRGVPGIALIGQVLALAAGFALAQSISRVRAFAFLSTWGASSLHIYLYHLFIIIPIAAVIGLVDWQGPRWVGFLIQIAVTLAAILASLMIMRWTAKARWLLIPPRSWTSARVSKSSSMRSPK
ncbi:acyltransferase family protein [Microbacterium sp. NPDC064584]|uniref:acyltransferase family protein n=1 Tax=Microbacterium sp. NPDC064584 TaxID=3155817 RepID=UPI003416524D